MTTDILVRVNGNYVTTGKLTINRDDGGANETREIQVTGLGSNSPVAETFNVPHGSIVSLELIERQCTPAEVAAGRIGAEEQPADDKVERAGDQQDDADEAENSGTESNAG